MILAGHRERVAQWVVSRIRHQEAFVTSYEALGAIDKAGNIIGGFVYCEHRSCLGGGSIAICAAGERDWLSRSNLKVFLGDYPFRQLGCHRVQAMVSKTNKHARNVIERLGFKNEGLIRGGISPGKDSILYGLLREESRWLEKMTK